MKPFMCSLTSEGVSVLMAPTETILIESIDRDEYWNVFEQLKAWERGFSGDEDQIPTELPSRGRKERP